MQQRMCNKNPKVSALIIMRQTTVIHFRIAKAWLTISGVVQVLPGFPTIPGIPTKIPNLQYWTPKHPAQFIPLYLLHSFQHFSHTHRTSLSFLLSDKKIGVLHKNTGRTSTFTLIGHSLVY